MGGYPDPGTGALVNRLSNPPNPFETLGTMANSLTAARQFQADQAVANAYRQSVDPQTGAFDQGKFNALASQGPGAWKFGDTMRSAGAGFQAEGLGTQANVQANTAQFDAISRMMYPLYKQALSGPVPVADAQTALDQAHQMGLVNDQQYQQYSGTLKTMPNGDAAPFIIGAHEGNQAGRALAQGNVAGVQTGPAYRFYQTQPQGVQPAVSSVQMGLSPEGALKLQSYLAEPYGPYTDAQGVEHRGGTKADFYRDNDINPFKAFTDGTVPAPGSAPTIPQAPAPAPAPGEQPPPSAGSTPGAGNWEVQHNNFAGLRNPNVPAAGGPNTNPSGWQQFPTPEAGVQAISNQLDRYASGATTGTPLTTIRGIVSTWAPASDGNPTPTLVARASQIVGVGPDQPLDLSNPTVKAKLVEAMIRNEQGGALPPTAAAAIPKVFAGGTTAVSQAAATTGSTAALPGPIVKQGQDAYAQAQTDAANMPDQISPLRNALGLLKTNADLTTGPGQTEFNQAVTGIAAALHVPVPQGASDLQELTKYLAQNIRAQQTGGTTDLGRLETEASNPNPNTQSREALQVLLAKTIGTTRLQNAALDYFNSRYGGPAQAAVNSGRFTVETSTWKKQQDPTAYAIDQLSPDQISRYFTGLSGTYDPKTGTATGDKAAFVQSMRDAKRLYNLTPPAATPPASSEQAGP